MSVFSNYAASIQLQWDVKDDSTIIGYYLHFGSTTGIEVNMRLGKVNKYVVTTLEEGKTYWFQIIPIHSTGNDYKSPTVTGKASDTIIYTIPFKNIKYNPNKPQLRIAPYIQ